MCHLVLLLPVIGLGLFAVFPLGTALPLYVGVLLLSASVYRMLWKSMRLPVRTGPEGMIGEEAVVVEDLAPRGVISFRDERWSAFCRCPIEAGRKVVIRAVDGLETIVEPL